MEVENSVENQQHLDDENDENQNQLNKIEEAESEEKERGDDADLEVGKEAAVDEGEKADEGIDLEDKMEGDEIISETQKEIIADTNVDSDEEHVAEKEDAEEEAQQVTEPDNILEGSEGNVSDQEKEVDVEQNTEDNIETDSGVDKQVDFGNEFDVNKMQEENINISKEVCLDNIDDDISDIRREADLDNSNPDLQENVPQNEPKEEIKENGVHINEENMQKDKVEAEGEMDNNKDVLTGKPITDLDDDVNKEIVSELPKETHTEVEPAAFKAQEKDVKDNDMDKYISAKESNKAEDLSNEPVVKAKPKVGSIKNSIAKFNTGSKKEKGMFITVEPDKCSACEKTVYAMEKLEMNKNVYHRGCFKCSHCSATLTAKTFSINEGVIYCTTHFKQLFARKGNYDEGFGRQQYKKKWAEEQARKKDATA